MTDARRVSHRESPIVCVPAFTFTVPRKAAVLDKCGRVAAHFCRLTGLPTMWPDAPNAVETPGAEHRPTLREPLARRTAAFLTEPRVLVADLTALNSRLMRIMVDDMRRRVEATRLAVVPIVVRTRTSRIGDFGPIEEFAAFVSAQRDFEVTTLAELHEQMAGGSYHPRKHQHLALAS
jgi:hypothetical protein